MEEIKKPIDPIESVEKVNPEPKKVDQKPKKNIKIIIGLISLVVLIILGVVGYGLYNGNSIASYAKDVKAIMVESIGKWSQSKIDQSNPTADEMSTMMKVVKADSNLQLKKLNDLKAPNKAKDLESKSKEYFQLANEASTNILALLDYIGILKVSGDDLKKFGGTTNSIEEFVTLFTGIHNTLSANLTKLRAATPPVSYIEFNNKYIAALDRMDKAVVKAIGYAESNQFDLVSNLGSEFEGATNDMNQSSPPNETQAMDTILSEAKRTKLRNYPGELKTEADELAKTIFSF